MKPTQSDKGHEKALEVIEGFFLNLIDPGGLGAPSHSGALPGRSGKVI